MRVFDAFSRASIIFAIAATEQRWRRIDELNAAVGPSEADDCRFNWALLSASRDLYVVVSGTDKKVDGAEAIRINITLRPSPSSAPPSAFSERLARGFSMEWGLKTILELIDNEPCDVSGAIETTAKWGDVPTIDKLRKSTENIGGRIMELSGGEYRLRDGDGDHMYHLKWSACNADHDEVHLTLKFSFVSDFTSGDILAEMEGQCQRHLATL